MLDAPRVGAHSTGPCEVEWLRVSSGDGVLEPAAGPARD